MSVCLPVVFEAQISFRFHCYVQAYVLETFGYDGCCLSTWYSSLQVFFLEILFCMQTILIVLVFFAFLVREFLISEATTKKEIGLFFLLSTFCG